MQNSRVIRRANAELSRCLSLHRRLCREIDELDQLLLHDEFLRDPRTLWLLQNSQQEGLNVDLGSSELQFKCSQKGIRLRGPRPDILRSSGSSADSEERHQGRRLCSAYRPPVPTPLSSLPRGSRARVKGFALPRPVRKMV